MAGGVQDAPPVYSSARIRIRTITEADLPLLWAAMQADDFDRFWPPPQPDSFDALVARYRWLRQLDMQLEIDAIATFNASGEAFAWLKLSGIDTHNQKAEFSIYIHHLRGTRAAVEALVAGIEVSMQQVEKIVAHTMPSNTGAQYMLAHLGFQQEGLFRAEIVGQDGKRHDVLRFGLLRDDWLQQPIRTLIGAGTIKK